MVPAHIQGRRASSGLGSRPAPVYESSGSDEVKKKIEATMKHHEGQ